MIPEEIRDNPDLRERRKQLRQLRYETDLAILENTVLCVRKHSELNGSYGAKSAAAKELDIQDYTVGREVDLYAQRTSQGAAEVARSE